MKSNDKIFEDRIEPVCLRSNKVLDYINVRTCRDGPVLESVLRELESFGVDAVLIPWLYPPFYFVQGYGIYSMSQARDLAKLEREEHWVSPRLGIKYDQNYFRRTLASLPDQIVAIK